MKIAISVRVEETLIQDAKKLAEQNKKNFRHPSSYSAIIEQALAEYLERAPARQKAK